jgi:hypothetical protein
LDKLLSNNDIGQAEMLLEYLIQQVTEISQTETLQPISRSEVALACNKVLSYWKSKSHSNVAITRFETLLKKMEQLRLANNVSYSAYISLLASKGDLLSAQRAQEILDNMLESYKKESNQQLKPNSQTWNSTLDH